MPRGVPLLAALAALLAASAMPAAAQQPVVVNDLIEARATVESVDQASRKVLLRDDYGQFDTVVAGPEVRNLAQVKVGDRVVVRVHQSIAVAMGKPGSEPVAAAETVAGRAKPGAKPAAMKAEGIQARVTILAVDPKTDTVQFVGPTHILRVVHVRNPKLQEFIRTLKTGDEVDVTYAIAVAVAVEPGK
jgi:hypothetical protein